MFFYFSLHEKSMIGVSALMWPWPKVSPLRYTITHPHNHIQWCPSQWLHCSFLDQATVFSNSYTHSYKHSNSNPNIANVAVSPSPGAPSFSLLSGHQTLQPNTSSPFCFAFMSIFIPKTSMDISLWISQLLFRFPLCAKTICITCISALITRSFVNTSRTPIPSIVLYNHF